MHLIRQIIKLLALAACTAFLHGCAAPAYKVTVVAGPGSSALGINRHGHTVGYLDAGGGAQHAFVNTGGGATDLGTLGGANSRAWAINDAGHIVGQSETSGGATHAFLRTGGALTDLGTLGGSDSVAKSINNADTVVGNAMQADGSQRAFSYSNGAMANLGTLPASGEMVLSYADAINDVGQIVGTSSVGPFTPPETTIHAFLRRTSGKMIDLGTLGGQYSEAFAINDKGEVVGVAATSTLHYDNAFLYAGGVLHDLGNLGGGYAQAFGINNKTQIVGASGGTTVSRGFLYQKGAMVALDTLVDPAWTISEARAINDLGQIAATGCKAGVCYAVRLDPK